MIKIRNLTAITTIFLVLAFIGCGGGGSSGGDDNTPVPDQIYSVAGDWTINAQYTGDPNNQCSMLLGPSYQATITIAESNGTVTITYTDYDISVSGTRQGNTLTYSGPVYYGTPQVQIGTVDGKFDITSDSTLTGTMTVKGTAITCEAVYDLTGTKNP